MHLKTHSANFVERFVTRDELGEEMIFQEISNFILHYCIPLPEV